MNRPSTKRLTLDEFINRSSLKHSNKYSYALVTFIKNNKTSHKTYGELYEATLNREAKLKAAGYNIVSIWENDWKKSALE